MPCVCLRLLYGRGFQQKCRLRILYSNDINFFFGQGGTVIQNSGAYAEGGPAVWYLLFRKIISVLQADISYPCSILLQTHRSVRPCSPPCNLVLDKAHIVGIYICINNKGLSRFLAPLPRASTAEGCAQQSESFSICPCIRPTKVLNFSSVFFIRNI
jgi:hypothetical protein